MRSPTPGIHCNKMLAPLIPSVNTGCKFIMFLVWIAVKSWRNTVLHLCYPRCGLQTNITGFFGNSLAIPTPRPYARPTESDLTVLQDPQVIWWHVHTWMCERVCLGGCLPLWFFSSGLFIVPLFFIASSHLLKLTFVLPPAAFSFSIKWKG